MFERAKQWVSNYSSVSGVLCTAVEQQGEINDLEEARTQAIKPSYQPNLKLSTHDTTRCFLMVKESPPGPTNQII